MNQQSSTSVMSGSMVKLTTIVMLLLLLAGEISASSAFIPPGGEQSHQSDIPFHGRSLRLRKMFQGKDGFSGHESLVISSQRKFSFGKIFGKILPSPPAPSGNRVYRTEAPPAPPPQIL